MKPERPETRFPFEALKSHRKLAFGESESVAQMKLTVHVRVGETREELVIWNENRNWMK